MKNKLPHYWVSGLLFLISATCTEAQLHHISVQVRVHDSDGNPVDGATVTLGLPMYARGHDIIISASTKKDGTANLSGDALFDYSVGAKKSGYYPTIAPIRIIATDDGIRQYATGTQQFDLELKPIKNPIPMLGGGSGNGTLRIPSMKEPVGFDVEQNDWVAPWGRGKTPDFVFEVSGYARSRKDYNQTLTLRFSNPGDGIQSYSYPINQGSTFIFPYEAPLTGYQSEWIWHAQNNAQGVKDEFDPSTRFIFRVRTELNSDGTVKRAMYGVLDNGLIFAPGDQATGVRFSYLLNPTWTSNLEVDLEHSVHAEPH